MATENIRNSGVGNSSVGIPDGSYVLEQSSLVDSPKRRLDDDLDEQRVSKRPRLSVDLPTPLPLGNEVLGQETHVPSPIIAALATDQSRWMSQPFGMLSDFPSPPPMSAPMTPWIPTPTNAVPMGSSTWGTSEFYPFSLVPSWDSMSGGLSHQLYQRQLAQTLQVLSPGASIAPLLAPVLSDNDNTPKKSPLLEPDNHKFYDHPALLQKLSLSKSPVLEAVIYCALNKWGIEMLPFGPDKKLSFKVTDFDKFSVYSAKINSKGKPTTDVSSRVKALRRWFDGIPKVKDRKIAFIMSVKGSEDKHSKVVQLVDKVTAVYQSRLQAIQNPDHSLPQGIDQ